MNIDKAILIQVAAGTAIAATSGLIGALIRRAAYKHELARNKALQTENKALIEHLKVVANLCDINNAALRNTVTDVMAKNTPSAPVSASPI